MLFNFLQPIARDNLFSLIDLFLTKYKSGTDNCKLCALITTRLSDDKE